MNPVSGICFKLAGMGNRRQLLEHKHTSFAPDPVTKTRNDDYQLERYMPPGTIRRSIADQRKMDLDLWTMIIHNIATITDTAMIIATDTVVWG